jgi:hypothetical protein
MSHEPSHATEHMSPPPAQAEEVINWFALIGVGLAALITFSIATFVVWRYLEARQKVLQPAGPAVVPARLGQAEVGIVDQVPFDVTRAVQVYRKERIERLSSWGWMDRKQGTIHMPIERAMDLVVQQQQKAQKEQKK